jgi:hypothetical protein
VLVELQRGPARCGRRRHVAGRGLPETSPSFRWCRRIQVAVRIGHDRVLRPSHVFSAQKVRTRGPSRDSYLLYGTVNVCGKMT